jgi:hypothetical protein
MQLCRLAARYRGGFDAAAGTGKIAEKGCLARCTKVPSDLPAGPSDQAAPGHSDERFLNKVFQSILLKQLLFVVWHYTETAGVIILHQQVSIQQSCPQIKYIKIMHYREVWSTNRQVLKFFNPMENILHICNLSVRINRIRR